MKYIRIGKIVNTHGIKGELRIISQFKYKDRIFKKDFKLYIGKDKICEVINTYRHHKQFDMVTFNNYDNINDVLKYKGDYVFINEEDLILNEDEYLDSDLINLKVICNDREIGIVKNIEYYSLNNPLLYVENKDKHFYIPYNFDIINSISLSNKEIIINYIKGLFD